MKLIAAGLILVFSSVVGRADLMIGGLNQPVDADFSGFTGAGFASSSSAGQLDSDDWAITGLSDGSLAFGGTATSGDFARGPSSGGVGTGGIYAFDTGGGNTILGVQPVESDFTPGSITLRIANNTGNNISAFNVTYSIFAYNDQGRANSLNFSYSTDDASYTPVADLDFTTPEVADGSPDWSETPRGTTVSGLDVADQSYVYFRWEGNDVSGSGSRDEYGIDNISVTAIPEPATSLLLAISGAAVFLYRRRR